MMTQLSMPLLLCLLPLVSLTYTQECKGPKQVDPDCMGRVGECNLCCDHYKKNADGCYLCACDETDCIYKDCPRGHVCMVLNGTSPSTHTTTRTYCVVPDLPVVCQLPMTPRPARDVTIRWYYDTDIGKCLKFNYSGCSGNANNFAKEAFCNLNCLKGTVADDEWIFPINVTFTYDRPWNASAVDTLTRLVEKQLESSLKISKTQLKHLHLKNANGKVGVYFQLSDLAIKDADIPEIISILRSPVHDLTLADGSTVRRMPSSLVFYYHEDKPCTRTRLGDSYAFIVIIVVAGMLAIVLLIIGGDYLRRRKEENKENILTEESQRLGNPNEAVPLNGQVQV